MTDHDPALEERARTLLTLAADTVPASSLPVDPPPRRPVWPLLAAAAAVVLVLAGGALLLPGDGGRPTPTPPGPVTVPQTLLMTEEQATRTLESAGLEVDVDAGPPALCGRPAFRAWGTRPAASTPVEPGSTVRLLLPTRTDLGFCARFDRHFDIVTGLLDLARFGQTDLGFAPRVTVWTEDVGTRTLSAQEATEPSAWGSPSPLTDLVDWIDEVQRVEGRPAPAEVTTMVDPGGRYTCGTSPLRAMFGGHRSVLVVVEPQGDSIDVGCQWLRVFSDDQGRIEMVFSEEEPTQVSTPEDDGSQDTPGEPSAEQREVAERFAAYARGGPAPAFRSHVELLLGNEVVASADDVEWGPRGMWSLRCRPGYAERSCPIDVLDHVASAETPAITSTVEREHRKCGAVSGPLPRELADPDALRRSVSLSVPEPASCSDAWEVQLWYDDQGRIYAANLILGIP